MGPDGVHHAPGDGAGRGGARRGGGAAEQRQLGDQLAQQRVETGAGASAGGPDFGVRAARLDDQVDGAVLEMQPPGAGQQARGGGGAGQAVCALYQSTISDPDQNRTPGLEAIRSSIASRCLMRCGTPLI